MVLQAIFQALEPFVRRNRYRIGRSHKVQIVVYGPHLDYFEQAEREMNCTRPEVVRALIDREIARLNGEESW